MARQYKSDKSINAFPPMYVPNSVKDSEEYGLQMFRAILDSTKTYRENRKIQVTESRMYARGKQSLQQYLDELNIEGSKQYININYTPTKVLQKFENIVVDDYQQLKETAKAIGKSYHIQERKERKKSNLRFRMQYGEYLNALSQEVGFAVEDPNERVPQDEEELDLITAMNPEEREELLLGDMIRFVLKDNDIEAMKRQFLSDIFQVHFGGYRHYVDKNGKIRIDFIPAEDALYDNSSKELFTDLSFAGSACTMTIGELRDRFNVSREKEELLYKMAYAYKNQFGNYSLLSNNFNNDWRYANGRPYDDFTVPVYHIWKKTVKNVGYLEGQDSYGKNVFDIDFNISKEELKSNNKKRTGMVYPETSYEGWFAGNVDCPVCLEWGESFNQTRQGKEKEEVLCPYIFFMPYNRGTMMEESAVEKVIADIQTMDLAMLKIKLTIANHPPVGYAIDYESLMDIDLGNGTLDPIDLEGIYQQTGKFYIKRRKDDGTVDNSLPITPLNLEIASTIGTYLQVYNNAQNNLRDTLGVNPNREGTANLNRVSNGAIQTQIAISQTATYYIYRAYLKATQMLTKHIGIRILDVLKYGNPDKGYLRYLGQENIDFIKEREDVTAGQYEFLYDPQITKEEEERLNSLVMASVTARELSIADALMIMGLKDVDLAEKYMRYLTKKNKEKEFQQQQQIQQAQAQAQGDMAVRAEEAKQQTVQIQSQLQQQEWEIKGASSERVAQVEVIKQLILAKTNGVQLDDKELQIIDAFYDNTMITQEHSMIQTERELQGQVQNEEIQAQVAQVEQAFQNGDITEQEANEMLQQLGVV